MSDAEQLKRQKVLAKVEKLMRMADPSKGASVQEQETAMRKAQELMTEHGIEMAALDIEGDTTAKVGVNDETINTGRPEYDYDRWVNDILYRVFEVRIATSKRWVKKEGATSHSDGGYRHHIIMVGTPEDIAMAKMARPILEDAMKKGLKFYLDRVGQKWTSPVANGFYKGVRDGYIHGSEEGKAEAYKRASKEQVDKYAIVLVNKSKAITAYVDTLGWGKSKSRGPSHLSGDAYKNGVQTGASTSTRTKLN